MSDPYSTLPSTDVAVGDDPYGALPAPQAPAAPVVPVDPYMAVPHDPRYGGYPNADDPTLTRYGIEAVKGFTESAKNQAATSLVGAAATSKGPAVVGGFGIMSPQEEFLAQEEMSRNVGPLDPNKNPLMIAGRAVQNFGKDTLAPAPGFEHSWTRDISGGFGSLLGNVGMGLLSPGAAALGMVTAGSGEAYDTAIQKGATAEQAARAAQLGTVPGATDMVDMMLGSLGTTGKVAGFIRRVGTRAIKGAIAEGGQEAFQQFLQNAISKGVYKPDQDLMEDVPRSLIIGAIVGGVATPALHKREDHGTSPANAPTEAEIARYFTGNTPDPTIRAPSASTPAPTTAPVSPIAGVEPVPPPLEPTDIFPPSSPTAPNVTRLAIPVEPEPRTKNEVPAEVVNFLAKRSQKLGLPSEDALAQGTESDLTPQMEEISSTPGANVGRLARLLGPKLYGDPTDMDKVSVKEIVQNSFDAIKTELEKGSIKEGQLHINMDPTSRTIRVYDNGSGMTPEVLAKQFLEIAGTHKESARASGGLGIAKMLFLFANKGLRVSTMRNGKIARLVTTGDELFNAMDNKSKAPKIQIDNPTAQDRSIFKDGHGTVIEVTVPQSFQNSEGQQQEINFDADAYGHKVLTRSPLFDNIEVHFNGKPLNGFPAAIGKHFPADQYQPLFNAKFGWGTAHFYVSKTEQEHMKYSQNMHVLSNGLWQFSGALKKDPAAPYGENVERTFYVDVSPTVKAEDAGYPFDLNRQKFSATAKEDLGKIFSYLSVLYQHQELASGATNFGQIHYLHDDNGNLVKSRTISIEPKALPTETPLNMIRPGDAVSIVDGKIVVNGREIPEIKPEDVKKYTPDASELKVDQKEIDPNRVMVHDNVIVRISDVEAKSIIELGEEKFGPRFDQFLLAIGNEFKLLRDVVASTMDYPDLKKEAIGISFDTKYRGVSIRLPFSGSFLNPAVPEYSDPLRASVGMVLTMVHELSHHKERNHDAAFAAEMQRITIHLDTHPTFDFFALKQRMVNYVAQNKDIFDYINGVFSGAFPIEPRGKRFEDDSSVEARDGSRAQPTPQIGGPAEGRSSIPSSVGTSTANTPSGGGRGRSYFRATENGPINLLDETAANTRAVQQASGDPDVVGAPAQVENLLLKDGVKALFQATSPKKKGPGGGPPIVPPAVAAMAAHGDELSWYYKFAMGLDRLVDRFPNFAPLLRYAERSREMKLDSARIQDAALRIAKEWRSLGDRAEPLAALIDDVANMRYLSDSEKKNGVERHPTKQEFTDLVRRHKVSSAALNVFFKQKNFFHVFLDLVRKNAIEDARRTITDPVKLANKIDAINIEVKLLADRPYFPMLNFGTHYVAVVDSAGEYVFFKTYERRGLKSAQQVQQEARRKLETGLPADHTVIDGILPESTQPFVGLPRMLLEGITSSMSLTPAQQTALKQMRFGSTASRYKYLFEHKSYVPGYSHDFLRAFSRYAFHGARFYARTKYIPSMQKEINNVRLLGGNQAGSIANYMEDHLYNTVLDAKGDYGKLKGAIFLFTFGYSVAGATINLSQIPFFTHNFLSTRFGGSVVGDRRSAWAILKAGADLKNFYKRGSYENQSEFVFRALDYGITSGRITEAQASDLAGLAQGDSLLGMGKSKMGNFIQKWVLENGAKLFEFTEQYNRRVTYRAALDLAMKFPNSKGVQEAMNKHLDEFNQLVAQGWNAAEAKAVVTAAYATEQTQFSYARENRPRMMRGKLASTVLVFQNYLVNVLQLLGANKSSMLPRFLLMMGAMGGLYGMPGADELEDMIELTAKYFFGKDFKVKLYLRELMVELGAGDKADLLLHGLSRRGFGVPALLDLMGEHPGRGLGSGHSQNIPVPILDRSKSVGVGHILPVDFGKILDPGKDVDKMISEQGQRASGAVFSVGFNLIHAIFDMNHEAGDLKRWEKAMPRALASTSRAYRAFTEGRERGKGGPQGAATIVPYDIRDTEQMAEIIAMALGYTPLRQAAAWDRIIATNEVNAHFDIEREVLMKQFYEANAGGNQKEIDRVTGKIIDFNDGLPDWAKGKSITQKGASQSLKAKQMDREAKEAGLPVSRKGVDLYQHIQSLFPESVVDVRRVK